jgi:hypothetical protein
VILGPVLGGLLYVFGPNIVYLVSSAMLALSVLLMSPAHAAPQAHQGTG